jgi:hypothetical protein
LRYSTSFALSSVAGAVVTYVFRANDLFDPDLTGTGHQPMGFDQMMVFYQHFCVVKARIIVTAKTESGDQCTVCVRQDASATPLTVIDRIIEFGGLVQDQLGATGDFGSQKSLTLALDVARLQGLTSQTMLADPSLRGDAATSPTELTYFHISIWDAGGQSCSANLTVVLEQDAYFLEPRDATES